MHRASREVCVFCEKIVTSSPCPECNSPTLNVSARFRVPKKGNKNWKYIRAYAKRFPEGVSPTFSLVYAINFKIE